MRTRSVIAKQKKDRQQSLARPMAPASLLTLPLELQKTTFEYIASSADLSHLSPACKELRNVVVPLLYNTVTLSVCDLEETKDSLHAKNPGLSHIRHLVLTNLRDDGDAASEAIYLNHVLRAIPKDQLITFNYPTLHKLAVEIPFLIRLKQRRLTNYLQHHKGPDVALDHDELQNVTSLSFFVASLSDCERAARVLASAIAVRDLRIVSSVRHAILSEGNRDEMHIIFSPWMNRPEEMGKLRLKKLGLQDLDVEDSGGMLPTVIEVACLETLSLFRCVDVSFLLESLIQASINLKTLRIEETTLSAAKDGMLNAFLSSFAGLKELKVSQKQDSDVFADCHWLSIQRHSQTLRSLIIDDEDPRVTIFMSKTHDRSMEAFRTLCMKCRLLEQVAIRTTALHYPLTGKGREFSDFMKCLSLLPRLTVLRLLTYPPFLQLTRTDDEEGFLLDDFVDVQLQLHMQGLADELFQRLRSSCPDLHAVVIDAQRQTQDCSESDSVQRYAYLRAHRTDIWGRTTAVGTPMDAEKVKLHEPGYEILEDRDWVEFQ